MNTNDNVITIQPLNYDLTREHADIAGIVDKLELTSEDIDPSEVCYDVTNDGKIQETFDCLLEEIDVIYKGHRQMILNEIERIKSLIKSQLPKDYIKEALKKTSFKGQTVKYDFTFSLDDLVKSSPSAKLFKDQAIYLEGVTNISLKKYHLLAHDWADKISYHLKKTIELFCKKSNGLITFKSLKTNKKGPLFNLNLMKNKPQYLKPVASFTDEYLHSCACFWYTNSSCLGFNAKANRDCCVACCDACDRCPGGEVNEIELRPSKLDEYTQFSKTSVMTIDDFCRGCGCCCCCCLIAGIPVTNNAIPNPLNNLSTFQIELVLKLEPIPTPLITSENFDSVSLCSVSSLPQYDQLFSNLPTYESLQKGSFD